MYKKKLLVKRLQSYQNKLQMEFINLVLWFFKLITFHKSA